MQIKHIDDRERNNFNKVVNHPLQSYEWGEFREKTGIKVIRNGIFDKNKLIGGFQLTIHRIPHSPFNIGYFPKGEIPTQEVINELLKIGKEEKCIFIQLEPNRTISTEVTEWTLNSQLVPAAHPLFTKYTFILDLTKSEEELLKNMQPKTRYNIKVAQKHNVRIIEDDSNEAFEEYLKLTKETTKRQGFFAHTSNYHRLMWETLKNQRSKIKDQKSDKDSLTAHLFLAKYKPPSSNSESSTLNSELTLAAWILFVFHDTIYYTYGASSSLYRNAMASNLIMWEAIKFGKKLGLKKFDMWGALGPDPNPKDPWFGFHRFKQGYGATHTEFIRSLDLVIQPFFYQLYKGADKIRWALLKFKKW